MLVIDIKRKVQRLFGDSASEIIINQQDIWDWINEAQLKIVRETHCLSKSVTAAASTYVNGSNLPADWIVSKRLTYNNLPLKMVDIDDLDTLGVDVTQASDSPTYYYHFAKQIRFYPKAVATDVISVVFDYIYLPTTIIADATPLDVPVSYHEDIVRFCIMRAHERNQNYKMLDTSNAIFSETAGIRKEEASLQDDDFFVVRDDVGEDW